MNHYFFFNDTATPEIYTLSLHDALPIFPGRRAAIAFSKSATPWSRSTPFSTLATGRSEEHTSELQSHVNLVCRLLLEKKKYNATVPRRHAGLVHVVLRTHLPNLPRGTVT